MITIEIFSHGMENSTISFEMSDFRIVSIDKDDYVTKSDFDKLEESVFNLSTEELIKHRWYNFTFKRMYDDDGSGSITDLWFELVTTSVQAETEW